VAYSLRRAAVAIWRQVRASSWGRMAAVASSYAQSARPQTRPWTSANRPDTGLDTCDGRGVAAGDVLDVFDDLLGAWGRGPRGAQGGNLCGVGGTVGHGLDRGRVRQVHGLVHVGLPPTPTLLLVEDDNGRSDHIDTPG
jgi:hypothetical protein